MPTPFAYIPCVQGPPFLVLLSVVPSLSILRHPVLGLLYRHQSEPISTPLPGNLKPRIQRIQVPIVALTSAPRVTSGKSRLQLTALQLPRLKNEGLELEDPF